MGLQRSSWFNYCKTKVQSGAKTDLESFYLWWGPPMIYHLGREEMDLYVRVGHLVWKEIRTLLSW